MNLLVIDISVLKIWNRYRETEESSDNRMSEDVAATSERIGDFLQIWRRPSQGFIKINTDAAMSKEGSVLAFIARNEKGETMHIHTFKSDVFIPEVAEMEAILRAMQAATRFGWSKVSMESDAALVISSITARDFKSIHWTAEQFFKDILLLIPSFASIYFGWVPRRINGIADYVGKRLVKIVSLVL
ncbi:uncharacterized protein LOC125420853 [Ziziphus jujuba]|uniref:Uncharacterized protein LOC125420853 n=1 Tax=Ziziphus jujuba TaxID=326968 RepID=A0ABM3I9V8_ZIZJJ|nr:uncharacterized protein LOC125420853 [Ziziphus jujuba]